MGVGFGVYVGGLGVLVDDSVRVGSGKVGTFVGIVVSVGGATVTGATNWLTNLQLETTRPITRKLITRVRFFVFIIFLLHLSYVYQTACKSNCTDIQPLAITGR